MTELCFFSEGYREPVDGVNRHRRKKAVSLPSRLCECILVVEDGRPVIGCGLHASPREIVHCEMAIIKVVPRICLFVLGVLNFKDFFISDESIYFEKERNYTWNKSELVTSL